jgi:hypothetical protein
MSFRIYTTNKFLPFYYKMCMRVCVSVYAGKYGFGGIYSLVMLCRHNFLSNRANFVYFNFTFLIKRLNIMTEWKREGDGAAAWGEISYSDFCAQLKITNMFPGF